MMFPIDMLDALQQPTVVVIAEVAQIQDADRNIGVCVSVSPYGTSLSPSLVVQNYFSKVEHRTIEGNGSISILRNALHGSVFYDERTNNYKYVPVAGFSGSDSATLLVSVDGVKVTVIYSLHVQEETDEVNPCDVVDDGVRKGSSTGVDVASSLAGFISPTSLLNYQLQNVNVSLTFANLANGAVGETLGHSITLDDDGAGHGWFIDTTPDSNDEFLPTSNPNEFIARPGSEAAGKMDLLTVLLHEYGHALGLDHDESTHQLMSEELQPGVRRTVSDAEMAKLWSLIGDPLNPTLTPALSLQGEGGDPSAPFNPLPLGLSFFFGFARRRIDVAPEGQGIVLPPLVGNDPNAISVTPQLAAANNQPQYELATHSDVFNGEFSVTDTSNSQYGWRTRGNVSLNSGAAEILESDRTLSGFSQAFVLPADVRALRFTIEAAQFTANGAAPPDAFEMALLNSVTELPVVGTVSLTHSDALLNLQSDGTLTTAAGVTVHGLPAAGSGLLSLTSPVTVTVDVSGIPAGTSLKLYFDLLGLGAKGSR